MSLQGQHINLLPPAGPVPQVGPYGMVDLIPYMGGLSLAVDFDHFDVQPSEGLHGGL